MPEGREAQAEHLDGSAVLCQNRAEVRSVIEKSVREFIYVHKIIKTQGPHVKQTRHPSKKRSHADGSHYDVCESKLDPSLSSLAILPILGCVPFAWPCVPARAPASRPTLSAPDPLYGYAAKGKRVPGPACRAFTPER